MHKVMVVCNPAGPGRSRGSTPPEARMSDNTDDDYDDKINPADAQVGVDLSMWNYGLITHASWLPLTMPNLPEHLSYICQTSL